MQFKFKIFPYLCMKSIQFAYVLWRKTLIFYLNLYVLNSASIFYIFDCFKRQNKVIRVERMVVVVLLLGEVSL